MTDAAGTRIFVYNNSGQLAKEIFTPKGTDLQFTIDRTYATKVAGKNGLPTGVTLTNKAKETIAQVAYTHDAFHRLQKLTSHQGEWIYRHDPKTGRLAGVQGPKHWALYKRDHQRGLLKAISNQALDGKNISTHHYQHDDAGNRIKITQNGLAYPKPQEKGYQYDNLHQVVAENRPDGKSTWDFDAIGNRLKHTSELGSQKSETTYKTNQLNQYTTVNSNSFELAKPQAKNQANKKEFTPTYNPNGSLLKDNKNTYQWNGENRLTKTTTKLGKTIESIYDFQGRRNRRITKDKQGNLEDDRIYLYDGWNVMAEINPASGNALNTYTWGNDLSGTSQGAGGVGGLLAAETETATFYPLFDGNGNVTQYLDEEGELAATFEYTAFGEIVHQTVEDKELQKIDYRFSTKPIETESDWYYYGYRYYDPKTGRWPSRDPIEESGGVNLYGFVGNNGIRVLDILGHERLYTELQFRQAAKNKWEETHLGNDRTRTYWITFHEENFQKFVDGKATLMKIVDKLKESKHFTDDPKREEGGWLFESEGSISSPLDWEANERGTMLTATSRPRDAIGDIHTHPWGSGPSIVYQVHSPNSGKHFSYTETDYESFGGADAPSWPDHISFVYSAKRDGEWVNTGEHRIYNPPKPATLYRFWWEYRVDCNGMAERIRIKNNEK